MYWWGDLNLSSIDHSHCSGLPNIYALVRRLSVSLCNFTMTEVSGDRTQNIQPLCECANHLTKRLAKQLVVHPTIYHTPTLLMERLRFLTLIRDHSENITGELEAFQFLPAKSGNCIICMSPFSDDCQNLGILPPSPHICFLNSP